MNIAVVCENPLLDTGLGTISRGIIGALHKVGHIIRCYAWGYNGFDKIDFNSDRKLDLEGKPVFGADELTNPDPNLRIFQLPYHVFPLSVPPITIFGEERLFNRSGSGYLQRSWKPDVILAIGDPHWLSKWDEGRDSTNIVAIANHLKIPLVAYLTIGQGFVNAEIGEDLKRIDYPVVYTDWMKGEIVSRWPHLKDKIQVVYHAVKPLESLTYEDRQRTKDIEGIGRNRHTILSVGLNHWRKGFQRLIPAVAKVKEKYPDILLLLHAQRFNPHSESSINLVELQEAYGLQDNVRFSEKSLTDTQLNQRVYGVADVYVEASLWEGWGLPACEATKVGVPVIATDSGAMHEIFTQDRGFLVPCIAEDHTPQFGGKAAFVDIDKLANTICTVFENRDEADRRVAKAQAWLNKNCTWEVTGKRWIEIIQEVQK